MPFNVWPTEFGEISAINCSEFGDHSCFQSTGTKAGSTGEKVNFPLAVNQGCHSQLKSENGMVGVGGRGGRLGGPAAVFTFSPKQNFFN